MERVAEIDEPRNPRGGRHDDQDKKSAQISRHQAKASSQESLVHSVRLDRSEALGEKQDAKKRRRIEDPVGPGKVVQPCEERSEQEPMEFPLLKVKKEGDDNPDQNQRVERFR